MKWTPAKTITLAFEFTAALQRERESAIKSATS